MDYNLDTTGMLAHLDAGHYLLGKQAIIKASLSQSDLVAVVVDKD